MVDTILVKKIEDYYKYKQGLAAQVNRSDELIAAQRLWIEYIAAPLLPPQDEFRIPWLRLPRSSDVWPADDVAINPKLKPLETQEDLDDLFSV